MEVEKDSYPMGYVKFFLNREANKNLYMYYFDFELLTC